METTQLKTLNQDDFKMKIIKDLGMIYATATSNKKNRYAIFECTECKKHFRGKVAYMKHSKQSICKACSTIKKKKLTDYLRLHYIIVG